MQRPKPLFPESLHHTRLEADPFHFVPICTGPCQPAITPSDVETSRESPSGLISCRSAKVLLAPSLSTMLLREQPHRARRMFTRMVQRKLIPESPCGASTKRFAGSSVAAPEASFEASTERDDYVNRRPSQIPFRVFVSKRLPLSDVLARRPFRGLNEAYPRPAGHPGIPFRSFQRPPALRPTPLSISPCGDIEKTPFSSTETLQPPFAGILFQLRLRWPELPPDSSFEASVQSPRHSNLHSHAILLAKAFPRAPITSGSTTIESASRHIPADSHLSALLD